MPTGVTRGADAPTAWQGCSTQFVDESLLVFRTVRSSNWLVDELYLPFAAFNFFELLEHVIVYQVRTVSDRVSEGLMLMLFELFRLPLFYGRLLSSRTHPYIF